MLKFLKNIFRKETEQLKLKTDELEKWFDEKTQSYSSELGDIVKDRIKQLETIKASLDEDMKTLSEEEIKEEEKILPKVKNVVLAARQNYIRELSYLLKDLNIGDSDKRTIINSCKIAQEKLDMFSQKTAKAYYTTQHLFHKPLESIAEHLKELSKTVTELNDSVRRSKTFKADDIRNYISKLKKDKEIINEWSQSLKELKKKKTESEEQCSNIDGQIQQLKHTEEYKKYEKDLEKLSELKEELTRKSNEIFGLIAPMQAAIKKYERIAMDNVDTLKRYLADVVAGFLQDEKNILLEILEKIKNTIDKGSIEVKDKKKDKILKQIEQITKEKLEEMRKEYNNIQQKIEDTKKEIENNQSQEKQEEMIKKKEDIKSQSETIQKDIDEVKEMISKIDIDKEKKDAISRIKSFLNIEVMLDD